MKITEFIQAQIVKLYTRRCRGKCGNTDPHDSHLTRLGQLHYFGRL